MYHQSATNKEESALRGGWRALEHRSFDGSVWQAHEEVYHEPEEEVKPEVVCILRKSPVKTR